MFLSNLGKIGDNNVQNLNIFLEVREGKRLERCPACLTFGVSIGAGGRGTLAILLTLARLDNTSLDALPFARFIALSLVRCLQIWLYFAFLGRF